MQTQPTFLLAGGGTGGHLTPGLAVADALRRRSPGCRVVFVGSDRPVDRLLLADEERRILPIEPVRSAWRHPWRFVTAHVRAWRLARDWIRELKPAAVCGLGGLASVPMLLAARRAGVPTLVLEQNVIPGRANRLAARWVDAVCTSFAETASRLPARVQVVQTGNPVRPDIARLARQPAVPPEERRTVLILGGSQGAQPLNEALRQILASVPREFADWRWVHQTGSQASPQLGEAYRAAGLTAEVAPFFNDLGTRLPGAALAISRSGATTLAELACAGVPAVLIPYPLAADRHQDANAESYAAGGGALVVPQDSGPEPFVRRLHRELTALLGDRRRLEAMSLAMRQQSFPEAAERVVDRMVGGTLRVPAALG